MLKWDSLFPGRRDYMILAVLPLRPMTIFAAKLLALCVFVLTFGIAVNLMGVIFFPAVVLGNTGTLQGLLRYGMSHAVATLAASLAGALLVITVAGLLLNAAPRWFVRRFSSWMQFGLFVFFVTQIFLSLEIANSVLVLKDAISWQHLLFPPLWFLGLYEQLLGRSTADLSTWAGWARNALAAGVIFAAVLYLMSYFRHFRRTAEGAEAAVAPGRTLRLLPGASDPIEAAIADFIRQTISRSPVHRLLFRIFLGAGCAVILHGIVSRFVLVSQEPRDTSVLILAAPLIISYFLLAGLRFLLDVPMQHPSSWIFRLFLDETASDSIRRGVRRVMFELGIVAWLLAVVPMNVALLGWALGLAHSVFCTLAGLIFLEALLFRYRRVPFTSALSAGNTNLGAALFFWLALFGLYAYGTTYLEAGLLARPVPFAAFLVLLYAAWRMLIRARERYTMPGNPLEFSDGITPAVLTLDLQGK